MKTSLFTGLVVLAAYSLSRARAATEAEWTSCFLHPFPQPLVFIATISGEGGRFRFQPESPTPEWLAHTLSASALGLNGERLPEIGRRYRVSGRAHCPPPHRWPSHDAPLLIKNPPDWTFRLGGLTPLPDPPPARTRFLNWLFAPFLAYPRLHGLVQATWTGQTFYQSPALVEAFRVTGLMAILALSGEHVAIFLAGLEVGAASLFLLLFPLTRFGPLRWGLTQTARGWRTGKWAFGAGLLLWTSGGLPSMKRTWWMAFFFLLLKLRSLRTSALQWLFSTFAVVLLVDPRLALSPGFLLSAVATFTLFQVSDLAAGPARTWRTVVGISFLVPLLTWPWTAHLFSQVAVAGPFAGALCGGVWAAVFLPAGFFLPFVMRVLPEVAVRALARGGEGLLAYLETGLHRLLPLLRRGAFTVASPTLAECLALESLALSLLALLLFSNVRLISMATQRVKI